MYERDLLKENEAKNQFSFFFVKCHPEMFQMEATVNKAKGFTLQELLKQKCSTLYLKLQTMACFHERPNTTKKLNVCANAVIS